MRPGTTALVQVLLLQIKSVLFTFHITVAFVNCKFKTCKCISQMKASNVNNGLTCSRDSSFMVGNLEPTLWLQGIPAFFAIVGRATHSREGSIYVNTNFFPCLPLFLLVTPAPNLPFITPLRSSTNWASSKNWSWDQLAFRLRFTFSSSIMIGGLEFRYGLLFI